MRNFDSDIYELVKQTVFADIETHAAWREEVLHGKMFGFLVVSPSGEAVEPDSCLHYIEGVGYVLYAYSGQLCGRSDWPGYVPAIFDYLQPDGYFKTHEAVITNLNKEVDKYRGINVKGEERRRLDAVKAERKERSQALQRWLFTQFSLVNPQGDTSTLLNVFGDYAARTGSHQTVPPGGTGECCAPKLLQYANCHHLTPLAIAEFWYGESPKGEVRHHGKFYEPCQAKCQPILWWMANGVRIEGLEARQPSLESPQRPRVIYEDQWLLAVDKPCGVLSVPGKRPMPNVQDMIGCKVIHRLDMDTSGILLAAKTDDVFVAMQRLFAKHEAVCKEYEAELTPRADGTQPETEGTISLPLSADFLNRPRQCVDYEHGKEAVTDYKLQGSHAILRPLTGRTHQLRMHCAHVDGLAMPILGDPLYGNKTADRMYLHASRLEFTHPVTGEHVVITSQVPWGTDRFS